MKIEIFQKKGEIFLETVIRSALEGGVIKLENQGIIPKNKEIELSVALVDKEVMRSHNRQYREKDEPTDVLSFCYESDDAHINGELILCLEVIKENAAEDGIAWEDEFRKNIFHGLLHVLGYEHGDEMFSLQDGMMQ